MPRSRSGFTALLGCCLLSTASAAEMADPPANTLTQAEKDAGWILLFDGSTLAGWRGYRNDKPGSGWVVEDGALVLRGKGGDLLTTGRFASFELHIDWKISPGGNSGIFYHVVIDKKEGVPGSGPEMQVLDNLNHPDGRNPRTSAGSCYAVYGPARDATLPVGGWNKAKLVMDNRKGEHWLNGERILSYEIGSDDWKEKLKASKFAKVGLFAASPIGHLALQDHGNLVSFRNIKIRVLPDTAAAPVSPRPPATPVAPRDPSAPPDSTPPAKP